MDKPFRLHNRVTGRWRRCDTLDKAHAAVNEIVGEDEGWVIMELSGDSIGTGRTVSEGSGPIG